jgi:hypothetical protein
MVYAEMGIKIVWGRSIGWNIELHGYKKRKMEYTIIEDGADCYPWRETFVIFPKKTITGKRLAWQKLYKRKVWVVWGTGFHMEPETQYATLFEILSDGNL